MTKLEWNLQELFNDNQSFYDEIENIKQLLKDIEQYKNVNMNSNTLLEMLDKKWKIKELSNNVLVYGSLMYYKNVNDEERIKMKKDAEIFNNEVNTALKFIDVKILELGFETVIKFITENPRLEVYRLSLDNLFRLEEHIQSDEINQQIKKNNDAINDLLREYNNLLRDIEYGNIVVEGEEVEITSSNFGKYISSASREVRKQIFFTVSQAYEKKQERFASVLNSIYGYRIENSNLEQYSSVLEKTLFEENINPKIIENLIKSVNKNLPLIQKYLKIKSDLLHIDEPHLYDFSVPVNNDLNMEYSIEDAKKIILEALKPLGEDYLRVVKLLFNGHIDAEPNNNKHQSITFSWNTYSFMNFRGSYIDLKNMIHEIGHIVNYYLSKQTQPFIYEDSTIFVGETASIVNEILLNRYLYEHASTEAEQVFYLSKEIDNYFSSVFKQTMYTEFENDLYRLKTNFDLTSDILSERYLSVIKKYYGDNVVYDEIVSNEWSRLGHIYRWSYYPYKYATGLLMASVVVNSLTLENTLSKDDYINFLSAGSSQYSLDLLKMLNIDLVNTDIMETGFNVMAKDINELQKVLCLKR